MKKRFASIALIAGMMWFSGCGTVSEHKTESGDGVSQPVQTESQTEQNHPTEGAADSQEASEQETPSNDTPTAQGDSNNSKSIVVYYSRTGDNYSVGNIEIGNTAKIAAEIAKQSGADTFEITPVKPYPAVYKECTDVAKQELEDNARPAIATTVENFDQYNTVYLGYPIWWGDAPMVVYSFLDKVKIDGKTIIPFCTHEGSGLGSTARKLAKAFPKAKVVQDGLSLRGATAQRDAAATEEAVVKWLKSLGKIK